MSSLAGHTKITNEALRQLAGEGDPLCVALAEAGAARRVVARDLIDVVTLGHWRNAAQCHHFMRSFDGRSEREAHADALQWVRERATEAARRLRSQHAATSGATADAARRAITASQALGDALHAVQDSFAPGHVEREAADGPRPGAIRRIRRYAGAERQGHEAGDLAWCGTDTDGLSASGRQAVQASRALLALTVDAARAVRPGEPATLDGFETYCEAWLRASDSLSNERDRPIRFLRRFLAG